MSRLHCCSSLRKKIENNQTNVKPQLNKVIENEQSEETKIANFLPPTNAGAYRREAGSPYYFWMNKNDLP